MPRHNFKAFRLYVLLSAIKLDNLTREKTIGGIHADAKQKADQ